MRLPASPHLSTFPSIVSGSSRLGSCKIFAQIMAGPKCLPARLFFLCGRISFVTHTHTHQHTDTHCHTHSHSRPFGCIIKFLSDSFRGVDEGVARCGMLMNSPGDEHARIIMHLSSAEPTRWSGPAIKVKSINCRGPSNARDYGEYELRESWAYWS